MADLTRDEYNNNILARAKTAIATLEKDERVLGPSDAGFEAWSEEMARVVVSLFPLVRAVRRPHSPFSRIAPMGLSPL